jgi:hypothetical protein
VVRRALRQRFIRRQTLGTIGLLFIAFRNKYVVTAWTQYYDSEMVLLEEN